MSLKLITAPEIEPVTVAEVKLSARISHAVEDSLLSSWITSARLLAEDFQSRSFIGQIWEMGFDGFPCLPIMLARPPLMQLISIKYYDSTNAETTLYYESYNPVTTTEEGGEEPATNADFLIDANDQPARLSHAYNIDWPTGITLRPIDSVRIRYAAGYGLAASNVPQNVRDAIILYCSWRNENRTAEIDAPPHFYNLLRHDRMNIR